MYNWSCLTPFFLSGASVVLIHDISSMYFEILFSISILVYVLKGGPGASGRGLPPVTGRSRVRVAVSSHCTCEGKACH